VRPRAIAAAITAPHARRPCPNGGGGVVHWPAASLARLRDASHWPTWETHRCSSSEESVVHGAHGSGDRLTVAGAIGRRKGRRNVCTDTFAAASTRASVLPPLLFGRIARAKVVPNCIARNSSSMGLLCNMRESLKVKGYVEGEVV
jgi:hypothetical protein